MINDLIKWQREAYSQNVTQPNLPPLKKNFFKEQFNISDNDIIENNTSTPVVEEGAQNTIDNAQQGKKPKIKISYVKIPIKFFSDYLVNDDFKKYLSESKEVQLKKRSIFDGKLKEVPCLLFEDFNTTGIVGDPFRQQKKINGKRNDFNAFWWSIFSKDKEQGSGGSVGIGRLCFAFSSDIQTFYSFSVPVNKNTGKNFFCGLSVFGDATDGIGQTLDPFARVGSLKEGKFLPILDEKLLKEYHSGLKLTRGFDEPGLSMIIPFPTPALSGWENINRNIVSRYRYAIFNDQVELEINGKILSKDTVFDFIKKYIPDELDKYQKYFDFIKRVNEFDKNNIIEVNVTENVGKFKKNLLSKEILDQATKDFANEQLLGFRVKFQVDKQDGSSFTAKIDCYLRQTESNYGCDDLMRQSMPVSGERKFEDGNKNAHALTLIEDEETAEFCRLSESENHKTFDAATLDEKNIYETFARKLRLITKLSESIHSVLVESDAEKKSSDATKDWFNFGDDSDEESDSDSTSEGTGKETKVKVPENLFEDPKVYEIKKIQHNNLVGFKIFGSDVLKTTEKTLSEIGRLLDLENKKKKQPEDEKTNRISEDNLERLKKQQKKLQKRLADKCKDLFPANIRFHVYEDLQKYGGKKSKRFYDPVNDFDLNKDIGKDFKVSHKNLEDLKEGKEAGNLVTFTAVDYNFSYEMITSKLCSRDGLPSDLTVRPWAGKESEN